MNQFFQPKSNRIDLPKHGSWPEARHLFDPRSVLAIDAALAAGRPLLLRGEPGIGKSQLARAVAEELQVPFLSQVIDERTERDDLLYHYDAVSRLAHAHLAGQMDRDNEGCDWKESLRELNFVRPGVLWWAFDWEGADKQADMYSKHCHECRKPEKRGGASEHCSAVVLIDEIDKADPSVPNGLLESLGNKGFFADQIGATVSSSGSAEPFIMVTTNEERELPAAFLRRCLVLVMSLPRKESETVKLIQDRVRLHPDMGMDVVSDKVIERAVQCLYEDRESAQNSGLPKPGASEALDLIHVLSKSNLKGDEEQLEALESLRTFTFRKHLDIS